MTLPTLTVLLDDGTGTFPFDITSKVLGTDGYQITKGRDDWQGGVTAGELRLTLDNSDGRFTPGSTILGTPSPIVVDQRIRLFENLIAGGFDETGFDVGGFDGVYARFTGYVKSWPVTWPATVTTFSEVQITATDAQARAERRTLRSMLEEEILADTPTAYYTLSEAAGSTSAGDTSGNQMPALNMNGSGTAVSFGDGTGPVDGLSAAVFSGGRWLGATTSTDTLGASAWSIECWFNTTTVPALDMTLFVVTDETSSAGIPLVINAAGQVAFSSLSGPTGTDGLTHQAAVTWDGTTAILYVDGVLVDSAATGLLSGTALDNLIVGGTLPLSQAFTGTMSHVATYDSALSSTRVVNHYTAGAGGTETTTARLARLAGYVGIPVATLDSSLTTVPRQSTSGQSGWQAMQDVADAEMGLLYVDGVNDLMFHNGNRVPMKTVPDLTLTADAVTPDVTPTVDDQRLVNYVEATSLSTGTVSVARGQSSEVTHGRYSESVDYLVTTDGEALDRGNWIVANFGEPTTRYGTLTINLYAMTPTQANTVLATLDLDCFLRVTSMAAQNPGGAVADVVVQGWQETATNESWFVTCNVVARSLYDVFIPDDPVYGIPDAAVARVYI